MVFFLSSCQQETTVTSEIYTPPPETEVYLNPFNPIKKAVECSTLPIWSRKIGKFSTKETAWMKQHSDSLPYSLQIKRSKTLHSNVCKEFRMLSGSSNDLLQRILQRIQAVVSQEIPDAPTYTAFLIEEYPSKQVWNAYSTGSYVYVGKAMFELAQTESQKAALVSHEIGHSLLGHSTNGIRRRQIAKQIVGNELSDVLVSVYNNIKPLNQIHELTTDFVACYLLYRAGYSSDAGADLFNQLASSFEEKPKTQQFLSSHPAPELRASCIREYTKKARARAKKEAFITKLKNVTGYEEE